MRLVFCIFFSILAFCAQAQEVMVLDYGIDELGRVSLEVPSSADHYYVLKVRHQPDGPFEQVASFTMGEEGTTIISEPLAAYPEDHYQVLEYSVAEPADTDGDGIDDLSELADSPTLGPFNNGEAYDYEDSVLSLASLDEYFDIAITGAEVPWFHLFENRTYVKYLILNADSDAPIVYFMNSKIHWSHEDFINEVGIDLFANDVVTGRMIYHPTTIAASGEAGLFTFNFSLDLSKPFHTVQSHQELLATNMPFLKNNLSYMVTEQSEEEFEAESELYNSSRVTTILQSSVYQEVNYQALNIAEGFGRLRLMDLETIPSATDIVLYQSLPNNLPRVGGIISTFFQTPLSHVNLRAIQDNVPNSFIRDALSVDSIANLLDQNIYYRVEEDDFYIRAASAEEVNQWFDELRPDEVQTPGLNLNYTEIKPLDDITFTMADGFGAKCANVATMRTFGFDDGTIPDGYGVPFYYYQAFMQYNGFFESIENMLATPDFQNDLQVRIDMLAALREQIEEAEMPSWMLTELGNMQQSFPAGTAIRCRSSTNNEDLPGFSGAGLYDSKTQHASEGHITKSIKEVYASTWNFRAFDARDFYRIDHFSTSMAVLCHPNFANEKANGVGVSVDPIYHTDDSYYLNTQVGEDLVTNPNELSIPEEMILDAEDLSGPIDYLIIRNSSLQEDDGIIMTNAQLLKLREYLTVIHNSFKNLYGLSGNQNFAMEIEYKIDNQDQLIIKQARPWASFWSDLQLSIPPALANNFKKVYPNPSNGTTVIPVRSSDFLEGSIDLLNINGQTVKNIYQGTLEVQEKNYYFDVSDLAPGLYLVRIQYASHSEVQKLVVE